MKNFIKELSGCLFGALIIPCIITIIAIITSFHKEIFNFIKNNIFWDINILVIVVIIILTVKLYNAQKEVKESIENVRKNYTHYSKELEDYKATHPSNLPDKIKDLTAKNKKLRIEVKELNKKLLNSENKCAKLNEMLYSSHIDKIIHLYHVPVEYKNVKKNENESKADFFNEQYPIGKNGSCPLGYADINVLCFKSANKQTNIVYIINTLFFDKERTQFVFFDKYNLENPNVVCNFLTPNKFSYVISNDFKKFIVRFTTLTLKLDLNNYRDKRNLLNQYPHTKNIQQSLK